MPRGRAGLRAHLFAPAAILAILSLPGRCAFAQVPGVPALEGERRIYYAGTEALGDEARLQKTIAELEAARPGQRFFVLVAPRDSLASLARETVSSWTHRVADRPGSAWTPDESFLLAVAPGSEEPVIEVPTAARDQLGYSLTVRNQLVASFKAPAHRGDLVTALDQLARALSGWVEQQRVEIEREKSSIEPGATPPAQGDGVADLSRRLGEAERATEQARARGASTQHLEVRLNHARQLFRSALIQMSLRPDRAEQEEKNALEEIDAVNAALRQLDASRQAARTHAERIGEELDGLRRSLATNNEATADLELARMHLADGLVEADRSPEQAERSLAEAETVLARLATRVAPAKPPEQPASRSTLKRVSVVGLTLIAAAAIMLVIGLRAERGFVRAGFRARRDEVGRDARDLRSTLDRLRDRRDQVARPGPVAIPLTLASELGLTGDERSSDPALAPTALVPIKRQAGDGATNGTSAEKPAAEAPAVEKPAAEAPAAEKPVAEAPAVEKPVVEAAGTPAEAKAPEPALAEPVAAAPVEPKPASPPKPAEPSPQDSQAARLRALETTPGSGSKVGSSGWIRASGERPIERSDASGPFRSASSGKYRAIDESYTLAAAPAFRGDTGKLLREAAGAIAEIGAAWDSAERALDDAEREAARCGFLARAPFGAARELLDLVPARVDLEPRVAIARTLLDRLGGAHDEARVALAVMWLHTQAAREALDAAVSEGLSPLAFEDDLTASMELAADAAFAVAADPVRAIKIADQAASAADALKGAVDRARSLQTEIALVGDAIGRVEGDAAAPGEPDNDPRGACQRARASLAVAASALEQGVPDEAARELERSRSQLALAEELLKEREESQRFGRSALDQRRSEVKDAREGLARARELLGTLGQEFARATFADIVPVLDAAAATEATLETALGSAPGEAGAASRPPHAVLIRIDAQVTELEAAARAVESRVAHLRQERESLRAHVEELERRAKEVDDLAKLEDISVRSDTIRRLLDVRTGLERTAASVRAAERGADVTRLSRELDAIEVELEEVRADVGRDAFDCRRILQARKAAEESVRSADDAIRRGKDRLAARARASRARELIEKTEPVLTSPATDWHVVLEAYSNALRASRGARELGHGRGPVGSDTELALAEAGRAIRRAVRFDAPGVRADVAEAGTLLRRAISESSGGNEAAAVEIGEKAAAAADEALRAALARARIEARAADRNARELARGHRLARESLERKRLLAEAQRRAAWISRRFGPSPASKAAAPAPA
jgi:hypothetical protein